MKAGVVVAPSSAQSFAGTETKRGETIESTAESGGGKTKTQRVPTIRVVRQVRVGGRGGRV